MVNVSVFLKKLTLKQTLLDSFKFIFFLLPEPVLSNTNASAAIELNM